MAGANQFVYGDFSIVNGTLRATATEEDLVTRKVVVVSANGPADAGIFPVADALARQLGETHPFGTRNPQALRDYASALDSPDDPKQLRWLRQGGRYRSRFLARLFVLAGYGDCSA